jgi:hypothetical protein
MLQFKTISGSVYEVDQDNRKIRRLYGNLEPTKRQGNDNEWKEYETITPIEVGSAVIIGWKVLLDNNEFLIQSTMTSLVLECSQIN